MINPKPIEGFEDYLIDVDGSVYTAWKKKRLATSMTREGAAKVTLYRNGKAFTKSLALLVAKTHLYNDFDPEVFDTPIHLDNDLLNNHVENLAWRPRWFAVKYQQQYWNENYRNSKIRIMDVVSGEIYDTIMGPCQRYGYLFVDVMKSCTNGIAVFPSWREFRFVD